VTGQEKRRAILRPLAYRPEEAALALGVSEDYFRENIAHELRAVRTGRLTLYPVPELEAWLQLSASLALEASR
jgi:excisionase family DNA binding protein